jgi:hypothetical protein
MLPDSPPPKKGQLRYIDLAEEEDKVMRTLGITFLIEENTIVIEIKHSAR